MRIWKRNLYAVCGEEPSESVAGSDRECDSPFDVAANAEVIQQDNVENKPTFTKVDIVVCFAVYNNGVSFRFDLKLMRWRRFWVNLIWIPAVAVIVH